MNADNAPENLFVFYIFFVYGSLPVNQMCLLILFLIKIKVICIMITTFSFVSIAKMCNTDQSVQRPLKILMADADDSDGSQIFLC